MRTHRLGPSLLAALALLFAPLPGCRSLATITVALDQGEIQERVAAKFPVEKEHHHVRVTFENPRVILAEGSDRIGLTLDVRMKAPVIPEQRGTITATGKPVYRPETRAFYLDDPTLTQLDVAGIDPAHAEKLRQPLEAAARLALTSFPVYELRQRNAKEITAEHVLESVTVHDGKLYAKLALLGH